METTLGKCWINAMYIWTLILLFNCFIRHVNGNFKNSTQVTLCAAQCEALCLDQVHDCEHQCIGERYWNIDCNASQYNPSSTARLLEYERRRRSPTGAQNCPGTCSVLSQNFGQNLGNLLQVPNVTIHQLDSSTLELSWSRPLERVPTTLHLTAIYIVEETHTLTGWTAVTSTALKSWITGTSFKIDITDVCNLDRYRVMAINQYGTMGFSSPVKLPGIKPGLVSNIRFVGSGVYYYKNKDNPAQSEFMAILEWDAPAGWKDSDIDHYEWNPMVERYCTDVSKDSLPIFNVMKNQTNHILMTIASNSLDCVFTAEVRAVSRCKVLGPWTNFTVDLTNCSSIIGYRCVSRAVVPPDSVENVTLSVSSTPAEEMIYTYPQSTALNQSPLLVNLHIDWRPPDNLGSSGSIHHYMIRSGKVKRNLFPIPPQFIEPVKTINVSNDIVQLTFELSTSNIPYDFGVQVIAVGPGQVIEDNSWGLYKIYTIQLSRNKTGISGLKEAGKVLLDKDGIVIVYINNSLPVSFMFDTPTGRSDNKTIDRYAIQWGPLVGPDAVMQIENKTIVPLNQSMLLVHLQRTDVAYGIKVRYLSEDEVDDPFDETWEDTPVVSFTLPSDVEQVESPYNFDYKKIIPFTISGATLILLVGLTVSWKYVRHRQNHFKNLEQRLALSEYDSEDGDHYFVMRPSNESEDIPTVVADRWELPHCCLKMGRTLGCGAFGQVVKGRVSKTLLQHRGVDSNMINQRNGMHLTVAIKMLQDGAEDKQKDDFLKEINMMKNIGYHRNIVSILGCCTLRQPYCLVVEHMANGDLMSYFRKIRTAISQRENDGNGYINQDIDLFTPQDLLSVARQIANGMEYLSQKGYVHRDLAARNILVGENKSVKIGDFGLTRYIYYDLNKIYVNRGGGKLPLRWMAPEAIFDLMYSSASDVWSYGILLYEIVSLGCSPYPNLSNTELLQALKTGYRMERPDNCSQEIYEIMLDCWKDKPELRPTFTNISLKLTSMLEEDANLEYFTFNMPLDHDYYRIETDEMNFDDIDLQDLSCNDASENTDKSEITERRGINQDVVTEIPDESCCITELTKAELQDTEPAYTDRAFRPTRLSVSSIDNSLYSVMGNAEDLALDTNNGLENRHVESTADFNFESDDGLVFRHVGSATDVEDENNQNVPELGTVTVSESPRMHRTSGGSDDVFIHCENCSKLIGGQVQVQNTAICSTCHRLDFKLSPYDIHVSERTDSAICSTASYESDHSGSIQSEVSSATSDEYLMPDSPFAVTMATNETSDSVNNSKQLKFNFNGIQKSNNIVQTKPVSAHNMGYLSSTEWLASPEELDKAIRNKLYTGSIIKGQPTIAEEKWCIAKTKL